MLFRELSGQPAGFLSSKRKGGKRCANSDFFAAFVSVGRRKKYYEDNGEDAFLMVRQQMPPADPDFEEEAVLPETKDSGDMLPANETEGEGK